MDNFRNLEYTVVCNQIMAFQSPIGEYNLFLPFKNTGTAHHFANDLYVSIYNEINLPPPKTILS